MGTLEIKYIESETYTNTSYYGRFTFQPLKLGQGLTIGNALRRVLLSDLEGIAITSARVSGSVHEFSEIPGTREDVLEILLNLKKIVLKGSSKDAGIARLKVQGPCIVTASDFELPSFVKAVDPSQYIATICDSNVLEIEVSISAGRGYKLVNRQSLDSGKDSLELDAVFMPVNKVNYTIEEINTDFPIAEEKLTLEIWTNGSLTPEESLMQAATVLTDILAPIQRIHLTDEEDFPADKEPEVKNLPIEDLKLSVRAYNCLKQINIDYTEDLLTRSQEELLEIKNFGKKCCEEVTQALKNIVGLTLPKKKF
ncbi:RNA polymerase alpha subunit (plastid) [Cryptomonas paramecium]|uniref:DNA-directed RNA polymerase subunit alpha n=1 Tax=Cryptomonas paramaecium TaxID=2898 RepID=D2ISB5_9CRYP|nr:RNA polymerase alpha subunit [Cryptomonas paramecium]ACT46807.1 RNA polymerase alpha subunit [Cryptomonas paramecium]BDA97988.1 RNA polymerase alpha subunit [Cryptomonas paramecium]